MYDCISNNPFERSRVTYPYVWWNGGFSDQEIDNLIGVCDAKRLENSLNKINFIPKDENTFWAFERFNNIIKRINDEFYNFELNGYKTIQYGVYDVENEGKCDWHMDIVLEDSPNAESEKRETRKLTLLLSLNQYGVDYEGGEIEMIVGSIERPVKINIDKGRIIAFPSWMNYKIKPVTNGAKKFIAIWIEGPKFK